MYSVRILYCTWHTLCVHTVCLWWLFKYYCCLPSRPITPPYSIVIATLPPLHWLVLILLVTHTHTHTACTHMHSHTHTHTQYCAMPVVQYPQLENELFCNIYYLRHLCDQTKFPDWPIKEPVSDNLSKSSRHMYLCVFVFWTMNGVSKVCMYQLSQCMFCRY